MSYMLLGKNKSILSTSFNLRGFISLLSWMSATREFNEEVQRLRNWVSFLKTADEGYTARLIETSVLFAERFSVKGIIAFSKYLQNLEIPGEMEGLP